MRGGEGVGRRVRDTDRHTDLGTGWVSQEADCPHSSMKWEGLMHLSGGVRMPLGYLPWKGRAGLAQD